MLLGAFSICLHPRRCGDPHNAIEQIIVIRSENPVVKKLSTFSVLNLVTYFFHFFTSYINFNFGGLMGNIPMG